MSWVRSMKAVTFAMAFDYGVINMNSKYDARFPLVIGNARINDFHAQRRVLTVPEIFTNSSNIGTAKMALDVGLEGHQEFLGRVGLFDRLADRSSRNCKAACCPKDGVSLSQQRRLLAMVLPCSHCKDCQCVAGILNDGKMVPPTFMRRSKEEADVLAKQIVKPAVSKNMRELFRLNATEGSASQGRCAGLSRWRQNRHGRKSCAAVAIPKTIAWHRSSEPFPWISRAMPFSSCWTSQNLCQKLMALQHRVGMRFRLQEIFIARIAPMLGIDTCVDRC